MTIIIDQPVFGDEVVHKKLHSAESQETEEERELAPLPNCFAAPNSNTNAFGQDFRDYEAQSERQPGVENLYRINHINQSVDFVRRMREEYGKLNKAVMSIWECCELLNDVVDESDPDLDEPQIEHLLQTAEAIRKDYPDKDWLHLTGLIHDLGKVLTLPLFGDLPQWATLTLSVVLLTTPLCIKSTLCKTRITIILLTTPSMGCTLRDVGLRMC